jgi:lysophospholipase L1-like esterase
MRPPTGGLRTLVARMRMSWKPLLLLLTSCSLAILLLEALCRLTLPSSRFWFPQGTYVSDPIVKYRLAPNFNGEVRTPFFHYHLRTSSQGFRGQEFEPRRDKRVVAVFGDSFAFGQGVEEADSFAGILAKDLVAFDYTVINAGVYGYETAQEYHTYVRVTSQYRPNIVLLQVCWNDVVDQLEPIRRGVYKGYLNANLPTTRWGELKNTLLLSSELVDQVYLLTYRFKAATLSVPDFLSPVYEETKAREIESTENILDAWIREAAERKQQFVVFYAPHEWQVNPSRPELRRWQARGERIDRDAAHRWLVRLLKRHPAVVYVDVVEAFREHYRNGGASLYIAGDEHTNAEGHRLIAKAVEDALRRSRFVLPPGRVREIEGSDRAGVD